MLAARALLVAEPADHRRTGNGVKRQRVHVAAGRQILLQARILGAHHPRGGGGVDLHPPVMAGMKQQPRTALDTHVAQPQEHRESDWQWPSMRINSPEALYWSITG